jgi:hypothetical protein
VTAPLTPRIERTFTNRAEALAEFIRAAGEAPRLLSPDDGLGCALFHAIAALQWTGETGLVRPDDRLHAVWFHGETAAAVIERVTADGRVWRYLGPHVETHNREPADGSRVVNEPFVLGWEFTGRGAALAHFLVTTHGRGALLSLLAPRAPEVEHLRRWLLELFHGPLPDGADHVHALWVSTTGAGFLFAPATFADGRSRAWTYLELGAPHED